MPTEPHSKLRSFVERCDHATGKPYLRQLDGLVEQFEVERVALRIACRDLQDWHADYRDNRAKDYEPPDDGDVEQLMADLRRKAVWSQEELDRDRTQARERAERFGWTASNPASERDDCTNCDGKGHNTGWPHTTCPVCEGSGVQNQDSKREDSNLG